MKVYRGCAFPENLLYAVEQDVWVRYENGLATMGMTDPAQTRCGKFVSIRFKRVGSVVPKGKSYATVESAKWVGPFPAVLSGEVVETNEATFARDILMANREPYDAGWFVRVRPSQWDAERTGLVDAARAFSDYQAKIDALKITCMRCAD